MKIRLRAKARSDLGQIYAYSLTEFGEDVARRYKADIDAVLARLSSYPELGASEPKLGADVRSYPVGEHRIYYRIADTHVAIARVLHKRMDARRWN